MPLIPIFTSKGVFEHPKHPPLVRVCSTILQHLQVIIIIIIDIYIAHIVEASKRLETEERV